MKIMNKNKSGGYGKTAVMVFLGVVFVVVSGVLVLSQSGGNSSLGASLLGSSKEKTHAKAVIAQAAKIKADVSKIDAKIKLAVAKNDQYIAGIKTAKNTSEQAKVGHTYGNPPPGAACAQLTQQDFDNASGSIVLNVTNGCYEITTDIQFDYPLIVIGGGADTYFTCNNHTITKKTAIGAAYTGFVVNNSKVKNCRSFERFDGFQVNRNGVVTDSTAIGNPGDGFAVFDNGQVMRSDSSNNGLGFYLNSSGSSVTDSTANNNQVGFLLIGGTVSNSSVVNSNIGFDIRNGDGKVFNSTASYNTTGFSVYGGEASYNTAINNIIGFWVVSGNVFRNTALNNQDGFIIYGGNNNNHDNTAQNNTVVGFDVENGGRIVSSQATNNIGTGFVVYSGSVEQSQATGHANGYGFFLNNGATAKNILSNNNKDGVFVNAGALLRDGDEMCFDSEYGIFIANGGIVSGTFRSDKQIQGGGNWGGATIFPCGSRGGKEKSVNGGN